MGKTSSKDMEWENRVLCSDESCIGVIGPDGRCKECGRPYDGELPSAVDSPDASMMSAERGDDAPESGGDQADPEGAAPPPDTDDDEWDHRVLCRDEACIGVIGSDGRCKECGKQLKE